MITQGKIIEGRNLIKTAPTYENADVDNNPAVVTDIGNCVKHTRPICEFVKSYL